MNYRDKIKKLLALAESPEEHEAKAALLKAKRLMAEHKLTEADLRDVDTQAVKKITTDITCSKRRNPWIIDLSAIIGENYCCEAYRSVGFGKQTQIVGFIGFEDDVELCATIFKYAVDCVLSIIKHIKKENELYYNTQYVNRICNSYGYGFCSGVQEAFSKQYEENKDEWGLVCAIPKEVKEAIQHFREKPFVARAEGEISYSDYERGRLEGKKFDPTRRLAN